MLIETFPRSIAPKNLTQATAADVTAKILGQTLKVGGGDDFDNAYPIYGFAVTVAFTVGTAITPTIKTTATTPAHVDNLLGLVQRIQLTVDETGVNQIYKPQPQGGLPVGARVVIDRPGTSFIELNPLDQLNNDSATQIMQALTALQYPGGASGNPTIPVGDYEITYFVSLGMLTFGEPLFSRCLLPLHLMKSAPQLSIQFAQGTDIMGGAAWANNITGLSTRINSICGVPTPQFEAFIRSKGGYLLFDDSESSRQPALGSNAECKFDIPAPGQIPVLGFRHYKGGAVVTRDVIDGSGTGISLATGLNAETEWQIQANGVPKKKFRFRELLRLNDLQRSVTGAAISVTPSSGTATAYASFGANCPTLPATNIRPASVTKLDCLQNMVQDGAGTELGSTIDGDTPFLGNKKLQLVGSPASVATYASTLQMRTFRFLSDVTDLQKIAP